MCKQKSKSQLLQYTKPSQGSEWKNRKLTQAKFSRATAQVALWHLAAPKADHRLRLRRAIVQAVAQFRKLYPAWDEFLFDVRFLLSQGMPVIDRYVASAASNSAIELALAWLEAWPSVDIGRRKAQLMALTPIAAKLLRMLKMNLMQSHLTDAWNGSQANDAVWQRIGVPLAYVQAHHAR